MKFKAEQAVELTNNSEAHFNEAIENAIIKIKEQCSMGFRDAWVEYPKSDKLIERFMQEFTINGYTVHNRQGNQHLISW